MAAGSLDLYIEKGSDFAKTFYLKNSDNVAIDLTGCTAYGQIKSLADLSGTALASFVVTIPSPQSQGRIDISLSKATTSALGGTGPTWKYKKQYAYDIILNLVDGTTIRLLNGNANISPGVTA